MCLKNAYKYLSTAPIWCAEIQIFLNESILQWARSAYKHKLKYSDNLNFSKYWMILLCEIYLVEFNLLVDFLKLIQFLSNRWLHYFEISLVKVKKKQLKRG